MKEKLSGQKDHSKTCSQPTFFFFFFLTRIGFHFLKVKRYTGETESFFSESIDIPIPIARNEIESNNT